MYTLRNDLRGGSKWKLMILEEENVSEVDRGQVLEDLGNLVKKLGFGAGEMA